MKAVTYQGIKDVKVHEVPPPVIQKPDDILVKITTTAICGSDLHLIHGMVPNMPEGYVIGHEPMGIVEEVGPDVTKVKVGDRVIIPFNVSCGTCPYCQSGLTSQCDNSNPHGESVPTLGFPKRLAVIPVDRQNICGCRMVISHRFASLITVRWRMRNWCCFRMLCRQPTGALTMQA